jgi:hypothetical protein
MSPLPRQNIIKNGHNASGSQQYCARIVLHALALQDLTGYLAHLFFEIRQTTEVAIVLFLFPNGLINNSCMHTTLFTSFSD